MGLLLLLCGSVLRPRVLPPLDVAVFCWFFIHLVLDVLAFCLKKQINNKGLWHGTFGWSIPYPFWGFGCHDVIVVEKFSQQSMRITHINYVVSKIQCDRHIHMLIWNILSKINYKFGQNRYWFLVFLVGSRRTWRICKIKKSPYANMQQYENINNMQMFINPLWGREFVGHHASLFMGSPTIWAYST